MVHWYEKLWLKYEKLWLAILHCKHFGSVGVATQGDLFRARLDQIINLKHELLQLAGRTSARI
jgi:hypothetical protein